MDVLIDLLLLWKHIEIAVLGELLLHTGGPMGLGNETLMKHLKLPYFKKSGKKTMEI